jgi:uncharacterized protein YjbI with pentapeptide repeats
VCRRRRFVSSQRSELRRRWIEPEGAALAEKVVERLRAGKSLRALGIGEYGGRIDLRGLPASPTRVGAKTAIGRLEVQQVKHRVSLQGVTLDGLDLEGASLDGWRLRDVTVRDCRLDEASCQQWVLWDCLVKNCTFEKSDLRHSSLGTAPHSYNVRWEHVNYRGADLRDAHAACGIFQECWFDNARFGSTDFNQCTFRRCRVSGPVADVVFDGRDLRPRWPAPPELDVDFSGAYFSNVEFRGFTLVNIALPHDGDLMLVRRFPCVARWILDNVSEADLPSRQLRGVMANSLKLLGAASTSSPEAATVVNRRDWRAWGGPALEDLSQIMFGQAQGACSS